MSTPKTKTTAARAKAKPKSTAKPSGASKRGTVKKGAAAPAKAGKAKAPADATSASAVAPIDPREVGKNLQLLDRMHARGAQLTAGERGAFYGRFDDARCLRVGTSTQSMGVLRDATSMCATIEKAQKTNGAALKGYGPKRLAWLVECAIALGHAIETQLAEQTSAGGAQATVARTEKKARALRASLGETLQDALGDEDDVEAAALSTARGEPRSAAAIAESLGAIADLAASWLATKDVSFSIRVAATGLDAGAVDTARAAATALAAATAEKTTEGTAARRDTPATNLVEGRVVLEMGLAVRAFRRAKEAHPGIALLNAGPSTRHAIDHAHGKGDAAAPTTATPPAPAAGTAPPSGAAAPPASAQKM